MNGVGTAEYALHNLLRWEKKSSKASYAKIARALGAAHLCVAACTESACEGFYAAVSIIPASLRFMISQIPSCRKWAAHHFRGYELGKSANAVKKAAQLALVALIGPSIILYSPHQGILFYRAVGLAFTEKTAAFNWWKRGASYIKDHSRTLKIAGTSLAAAALFTGIFYFYQSSGTIISVPEPIPSPKPAQWVETAKAISRYPFTQIWNALCWDLDRHGGWTGFWNNRSSGYMRFALACSLYAYAAVIQNPGSSITSPDFEWPLFEDLKNHIRVYQRKLNQYLDPIEDL